MRNALFKLLTRLASRHSYAVLLVATALTALSMAIATRLEVKTNFKDLLGPSAPVSIKLNYLQSNFPVMASVRILLEGRDQARLIEVGQQIEARLKAGPEHVQEVILEQPVDFFLDHGLLYLEEDDLRYMASVLDDHHDQLAELVRDPSTIGALGLMDRTLSTQSRPAGAVLVMQTQAGANLDLSGPESSPAKVTLKNRLDTRPLMRTLNAELLQTMRVAPLPGSSADMLSSLKATTALIGGLADVLEQGERMSDAEFDERAAVLRESLFARMGLPMSRYNFSPNGEALVMDVVATTNILNVSEARPFLAWMEGELDGVRNINPDVSIRATGLPVMLKEESETILNNFLLVSVLGFLGILAVFIIGFERVGLPSLSAIPLLMGNAWTFGLVTATRGQITLFALAFPVLLFGLGIDYAIHLLAGYSEQRKKGLEPEEALQATFDTIGAGMLTGALTTAMSFLIMILSSFYGLQDMGFTAGVGVLMALLAMLTVLPALVILWDRRAGQRGEVLPQVPFAFLGPVGEFVRRQRYPVLAAFITLTLVFAYKTGSVGLDRNYLNMLPQGLPSAVAQDRLLELYGSSNEFVAFHAENLEEAERIRQAALASPTVADVLSPSALVPKGQELRGPAIAALSERLEALVPTQPAPAHTYDDADIATMRESLASLKLSALQMSMMTANLYGDDVQAASGELRQAINRLVARTDSSSAPRLRRLDSLLAELVRKDFTRLRGMANNRSLTAEDLPSSMLTQLRGKDGQWLVVVRAKGDVWDEEFRRSFLSDLDKISANQAGMVTAWHVGVGGLVAELPGVFGWICLVVGFLVLVDLRSVLHSVLALAPLVLAIVWTIGTFGMLGMNFNILSVVAMPLLVGIGIDNAIHLMHRFRHDRSISKALLHSGKPLILTSLTTAIGFGSLMLSVHPGIYGLGFATSVGMFFSLWLSLMLLPAMVSIFAEDMLDEENPS